MKFLLLICSLVTIVVSQDPSVSCRFHNTNELYQCELTIDNPNGFNNFTEIGGIHLEGFTNADVTWIYRFSGMTTNIPQVICDTFPNIIEFEMYGTEMTEIDDNALSGCSQIRRLYLSFNRINTIHENAFANLRDAVTIDLGDNSLSTLPENVFANQQSLTMLTLNWNSFNDLPAGLFRPLENLQNVYLGYNNLVTVNSEWFSTNSNLTYLYLAGNRINLTVDSFGDSQRSLRFLNLVSNGISVIPAGVFDDLSQLTSLDISSNTIETIDDGAFQGLDSLTSLSISNCRIRDLDSISFEFLTNLTSLDLNFNQIEEIPAGVFAPMPNLNYIGLWDNRLKTLRRNGFGTLTELHTLDLDGNIVNALDREIIDDAVNLNTLFFSRNLCANNYFGNFLLSRATFLPMLEVCFRNMRFIVDTTTENDGVYSFFEGLEPGIVLRVQSDNEIQIALTPFNFLWVPSIEIFIGSSNNTRSVIRINDETDVVTVPTTNVIQQNQWNDFRVTWANQNVLVFRANETYPFMGYTMQQFFPVNFYALRAVESRATWSVQPLDF